MEVRMRAVGLGLAGALLAVAAVAAIAWMALGRADPPRGELGALGDLPRPLAERNQVTYGTSAST